MIRARLVVEGTHSATVDLGARSLVAAVNQLPDDERHAALCDVLAHHPSSDVREGVAIREHISEDTFARLIDDASVTVIRAIVRAGRARQSATTEQLLAVIRRDVEAAEGITYWFDAYDRADTETVLEALISHADPRVRAAIAGNRLVPKKHLRALAKDAEPDVRAAALASLM